MTPALQFDWDDIRYFLALARHGSTTAASHALNTSQALVMRRLESLEARLATRLFERTGDGLRLTADGVRAVPAAERIAQRFDALTERLAAQDRPAKS